MNKSDIMTEIELNEPSEAACDAARGVLIGFEMRIYNAFDMLKHLRMGGYFVPPYLTNMREDAHITKWEQAILIWQCMESELKLQTKLDKAVEALEWLFENTTEANAKYKAQQTLAEIKESKI